MIMWNTMSPNLKRQQSDSDDNAHVFLEKRQHKKRKKRKKTGSIIEDVRNLRRTFPALPGAVTRARLTQPLGSLSHGKQGSVAAVRTVQNKLDKELAAGIPNLGIFKGPPVYRNLPKPAIFDKKPAAGPALRRIDPDTHSTVDRLIQQRVMEAWPHLIYEEELQLKLSNLIKVRMEKREKYLVEQEARGQCTSTPQQQHRHTSAAAATSATNLTKPFSSWSINDSGSDVDMDSVDFERSFCQTVKRTFYKVESNRRPALQDIANRKNSLVNPGNRSNALSLFDTTHTATVDLQSVSTSGLSILEKQAVSESHSHGWLNSELKLENRTTTTGEYLYKGSFLSGSPRLPALRAASPGYADSGHGSCIDFLDTISYNDSKRKDSGIYDPYNYHNTSSSSQNSRASSHNSHRRSENPELVVRRVKKDFIDVVDSLYDEENAGRAQPGKAKSSSGKTKRLRRINDSYRNFYLKREWMK